MHVVGSGCLREAHKTKKPANGRLLRLPRKLTWQRTDQPEQKRQPEPKRQQQAIAQRELQPVPIARREPVLLPSCCNQQQRERSGQQRGETVSLLNSLAKNAVSAVSQNINRLQQPIPNSNIQLH
jgi:hypothetical protein